MNSRTLFRVALMRHRLHARLPSEGGVSRLIALFVLGALLTGCQETTEPPLAPTLDGPESRLAYW